MKKGYDLICKKQFTIVLISLFAFTMTCTKVLKPAKAPKITTSRWNIQNGWVFRNGEKFFAIGLYGIPGYNFKLGKKDIDSHNIGRFEQISQIFNVIHVQFGREQQYMNQSLLITGWRHFKWRLVKGFKGEKYFRPDKDGDNRLNYKEMRFVRDKLTSYYFDYIQLIVKEISDRFAKYDFIWFLVDEPNIGGVNWYWHPSIIRTFHKAVKSSVNSTLTFLDIGGNIRGDRYSYELNLIKKFGRLPDSLPVGGNANLMEGDPNFLKSYNYSADGTPTYTYNSIKEKWELQPFSQFKSKYYDNVYQVASAYNSASDVIGVNCYTDFFHFPEAAGIVVDAIKDACGQEKPIWLFFDGAPDKKPKSLSEKEYITIIKSQVYTSIVHGATGVMFWARETTSSNYWKLVANLALELKENMSIFEGEVFQNGVMNNIHYSIWKSKDNQKYIIAVNPGKQSSGNLILKDIVTLTLAPLEVKIITL